MTELLLIRHGHTALAGTFCGQSDPPLDAAGIQQATELARQLAGEPLDAIYASDLQRARATAEPLAAMRGLAVCARPGLREIAFGAWEALRWAEVEQRDAEYARRWMEQFPRLPAPGGEAPAAFEARVRAAYALLVQERFARVAVVTHGGVMRVLLRCLADVPEPEAWTLTNGYGCCLRLRAGAEPAWTVSIEHKGESA